MVLRIQILEKFKKPAAFMSCFFPPNPFVDKDLSMLREVGGMLDSKFKYSKLSMKIYAEVNGKNVDDPKFKGFFKFKC